MPKLLSTEELKNALKFEYSAKKVLNESKKLRLFNIREFNKISREGLKYGDNERMLCLYETLNGEKIYIQYPGKESAKSNSMPLDFRPKLKMNNGEFISDISFGHIWDILSEIANSQQKDLPFVATIFLRLGYMYGYIKTEAKYEYKDIDIKENREIERGKISHEWYLLELEDDIWFTLNDRIGEIRMSNREVFSFEGFIKLVDLLFQNEDCKYYYKNVYIDGKSDYKLNNGRTQSSETNLLIINHLEKNTKLSELLNAFQKSRGVPKIRKQEYSIVTNNMVINIDVNKQ